MKVVQKIHETISKYVYPFVMFTVILAILAFAFFNFFPFNVAAFKRLTVIGTVQVGGRLTYTNDYCQNVSKNTDRTLKRFLVPKNSELVNPIELSSSPEDETLVDAGCRVSKPVRLTVDSSVPVGEYKLRVKACYDLFLRIRCVPIVGESDYFTITKPDVLSQLQSINRQLEDLRPFLVSTETQPTTISNVVPITPTKQTQERQNGVVTDITEGINAILRKANL